MQPLFSLEPRAHRSLEPTASARTFHIRRLNDVLQLAIQRGDIVRAKRAWSILARCQEVEWMRIWETGVLLAGASEEMEDQREAGYESRTRLEYLKILMMRHKEGVRVLVDSVKYNQRLTQLIMEYPARGCPKGTRTYPHCL